MSTLKNNFSINVSWVCPCCGEINNDKFESRQGVINELWCWCCDDTIDLETQTIKKEGE